MLIQCDSPTSSKITFPETNISYFSHVSPYFQQSCSCHTNGGNARDVIDLSTPEKVRDEYYVSIFPGEPDLSSLYLSMQYPDRDDLFLLQMPPAPDPPATANEQNGIKQWILEGAKTTE
jgi:hypothetical protein